MGRQLHAELALFQLCVLEGNRSYARRLAEVVVVVNVLTRKNLTFNRFNLNVIKVYFNIFCLVSRDIYQRENDASVSCFGG